MKKTRAEKALPKNSPRKRVGSGRLVRALAVEIHTAGLKEVRRREKSHDGSGGLYQSGSPRLIAAMEGIAMHVMRHYRPNARDVPRRANTAKLYDH
jgi:hypothetical protein